MNDKEIEAVAEAIYNTNRMAVDGIFQGKMQRNVLLSFADVKARMPDVYKEAVEQAQASIKALDEARGVTVNTQLLEALKSPRIVVQPVHEYECPNWRMGKKHGECNCGAYKQFIQYEQAIAAAESQPTIEFEGYDIEAWASMAKETKKHLHKIINAWSKGILIDCNKYTQDVESICAQINSDNSKVNAALIEENEKLKTAISEALDCFNAAYTEGLSEKLGEQDVFELGSLADLVNRRILFAMPLLQQALNGKEGV